MRTFIKHLAGIPLPPQNSLPLSGHSPALLYSQSKCKQYSNNNDQSKSPGRGLITWVAGIKNPMTQNWVFQAHWVLLFGYNHGNHNYEPTFLSFNHSNNNLTQKYSEIYLSNSSSFPCQKHFPSRQTQLTRPPKWLFPVNFPVQEFCWNIFVG